MGQNGGGSGRSSTSKMGPSPGLSGHPAPCWEPEHGRHLQRQAEHRGGDQLPQRGADPGWPTLGTPGGMWPPGCVSQDPGRAMNPRPELPSPKDRE